jgi:large subunit ribosomal protein L30
MSVGWLPDIRNPKSVKNMESKIKIKLVRSPICTPEKHKVIVRSLGLRKINQVVERPDTPGFRGMVKKIPHLLAVVE